jgi:SAM-dependent methyltransferase
MKQLKPYDRDFARLYDFFVYALEEVEADDAEIAFLKWAFEDVCPRDVKEILDIGCGTGRNLIPLARQGYTLTGLDNSAGMIDECTRRLGKHNLSATIVQVDIEKLDYQDAFDALLCMNSGLDYLLTTERIVQALRLFRRALRPAGILVLDSWNFLAQWERFGRTYSDVRGNDRIRIEYQDRHWYDNFTSIYHIEMLGDVHEQEKIYQVRAEHALRAMTVGEKRTCLRDAGFVNISVYPNYECRYEENPPNAERIIFLAMRSETEDAS